MRRSCLARTQVPAVLTMLLLFAGPLAVAQERGGGAGGGGGLGGGAGVALERNEKAIAEIALTNVAFPDVIEFLRSADPEFQVVVTHVGGVDENSPLIRELKLRNVTASQVLRALRAAYPELRIEEADPGVPIWAVRVDKRGGRVAEPIVTQVYRLREAIEELMHDQDRPAARSAVMSLMEAALRTAVEPDATGLLALHEATETLIVRGTMSQCQLVERALATLQPRKGPQSTAEIDRLQRRIAELEEALAAARGPAAAPAGMQPGAPQAAPTPPGMPAPPTPSPDAVAPPPGQKYRDRPGAPHAPEAPAPPRPDQPKDAGEPKAPQPPR